MSKVYIRTRQIDNNKQLPIFIREDDDLSDLNEYSNINRSSQILSGMDKGEENELHLQSILQELQSEKATTAKAIPIPEVQEESDYNTLYHTDFILHKNYIRLKTLEFEAEFPEYDLDEQDREWLENSKLDVTSVNFEKIVGEFERACSQKALLLEEAKSLLRHEPVHIVIAIYDYWLTKRVRTGQPLHLSVKAEKAERSNNTPIDPYVAFRKRSEKMTTRKNRRVDESSYEKMCRLKNNMEKLRQTIEFVSQREETKSQITKTERDIFTKRYESRDYDKLQLKESEVTLKSQSIKLADNFKAAQRSREENHKESKRKRPHSKTVDPVHSSSESTEDIDFTFRPMAKCRYLACRTDYLGRDDVRQVATDARTFSVTKLANLPAPLHCLDTPVRLRADRHGHVSIDLVGAPLARPQCVLSTSTTDNDPVRRRLLESRVLQGSRAAVDVMSRLYTMYHRDINCGLHTLDGGPRSHSVSPCPYHNEVASPGSQHVSPNSNRVSESSSTSLSEQPPPDCPQPNSISHHNGTTCTYQNGPVNTEHRHKHAFTESELTNPAHKRSPAASKELVDSHCNHSLNGGLPSKLSQASLNCLKSLTNKRLVARDDIGDYAHFYSKSNGRHQKVWLSKSTVDRGRLKSTMLPHVITSVNKMS